MLEKIIAWWKSLWAPKPVVAAPKSPVGEVPASPTLPSARIPGAWELPCSDDMLTQGAHPERKAWTDKLDSEIDKNYDVLISAKDIKELIPSFDSLNRTQRIVCLRELMIQVAKRESTWNPNCTAKDLNGSTKPELMATGLFQMNSAEDQANYRTGTKYTFTQLKDPLINIEVGIKILVTVVKVRGKISFREEETSSVLRYFYATLLTNGAVGPKVFKDYYARLKQIDFNKKEQPSVPVTPEQKPAWKVEAEKYKGKVETDAAFSEWLRTKIKTFLGYKPPTIATSTYAWCGYFIVTVLGVTGYQYHKEGEMARNWGTYGNQISWQSQGIPEGAIVWLNHGYDCKSGSSNHVALANGSCTVKDFFDASGKLKAGASIDLLGGNQQNQVKVSTYLAKEICGVRWPAKDKDGKPVALPTLPVVASKNCSSGKSGSESTQ